MTEALRDFDKKKKKDNDLRRRSCCVVEATRSQCTRSRACERSGREGPTTDYFRYDDDYDYNSQMMMTTSLRESPFGFENRTFRGAMNPPSLTVPEPRSCSGAFTGLLLNSCQVESYSEMDSCTAAQTHRYGGLSGCYDRSRRFRLEPSFQERRIAVNNLWTQGYSTGRLPHDIDHGFNHCLRSKSASFQRHHYQQLRQFEQQNL